jgi:hypothetical protein
MRNCSGAFGKGLLQLAKTDVLMPDWGIGAIDSATRLRPSRSSTTAPHKVTIVTGQLPISTGICRSATPPSRCDPRPHHAAPPPLRCASKGLKLPKKKNIDALCPLSLNGNTDRWAAVRAGIVGQVRRNTRPAIPAEPGRIPTAGVFSRRRRQQGQAAAVIAVFAKPLTRAQRLRSLLLPEFPRPQTAQLTVLLDSATSCVRQQFPLP